MSLLPLAEACLRNQEPIRLVLEKTFQDIEQVLEIGSGTGQHAVYLCKHLKHLVWQPSEVAEQLANVEAWRQSENLPNLKPCVELDVMQKDWNINSMFDAVFTANTIHYIGWNKVEALLKGAAQHLKTNGKFVCYGPFNKNQQFTSEGNRQLDSWLKSRDPESGIKDRQEVITKAKTYGLKFIREHTMPANNVILEFEKEK